MKENKLNPIIELWDLELKDFDANKAFKIIQIRTECEQLVQEQLLMFCKEQKIESQHSARNGALLYGA